MTSIAQGNLQIMGIVSTSITVAPLSMGIAAVVGKDKFTPDEKSAGIYTIFMGIIGISEGRYLLQLLILDTFFRQFVSGSDLLELRLLCAA